MSRKQLLVFLGSIAWMSTAIGGPLVSVSKTNILPAKTENTGDVVKQYSVTYNFVINSAAAKYIKSITVTPVSSGTGQVFSKTSSNCGSSIKSASCMWTGVFKATKSGKHTIYLDYGYGGLTFSGKKDTMETTTSGPRAIKPASLSVALDTAFDKPSVKRLKVENTGEKGITNLVVNVSALGVWFTRFDGTNGTTPVGPWCTAVSCPSRCGALGGKLSGGASCYVYLRATGKNTLGNIKSEDVIISGAGKSKTFTAKNERLLYAAGKFVANTKEYVAQYDGSSWTSIGDGPKGTEFNEPINTLAIDAMGNLYAGGAFTASSNRYVAKYNGSSWSNIGSGKAGQLFNENVNALVFDSKGNLYAGGDFTDSTNQYVAKYNGSSWSNIGSGKTGSLFKKDIFAMAFDADDNLYVGGAFTDSSSSKQYVAKWNGTAWSGIGSGGATKFAANILTIATDVGDAVYVAGAIQNATPKYFVAKYSGSWSETAIGDGPTTKFDGEILTMLVYKPGGVYVAGKFQKSSKNFVAKYDGSTWSNIGDGPSGKDRTSDVNTMVLDGANLYVAGKYQVSSKNTVQKYDGTSWSTIGAGPASSQFASDVNVLKLSNKLTLTAK